MLDELISPAMYTFLSKDDIGLKSLKIRGCHTYYKFILLFGRIMTYTAVVYFEYWYKYFKYSQQGKTMLPFFSPFLFM